jgi:hypothetical protein
MPLVCAEPTDKTSILTLLRKLAGVKLEVESFIDLAGDEVEVGEVGIARKLRGRELVSC